MPASLDRVPMEFAHILFLDIVGYSRQSINRQAAQIARLRQIVEASPEYRHAKAACELVCLDRGDGMALVFARDPVSPLQCALEISRALAADSSLPLRMGVHTGPVARQQDITDKPNVYGDGINMAQRVMDCGDEGHILLSRATVDVLYMLEEWSKHLQDLGEVTVKHGHKLHLHNYYDGETGNPDIPVIARAESNKELPEIPEKKPPVALRVALLYRRNVQPDDHVLALLERELQARGYGVFIDRHLTVGVEWAQEIERQVVGADAVIPLLSEASTHSEMLEDELQTAHRAALSQQGRPRLLPVRVAYTQPLPPPLAGILDPLQFAEWNTQEDDSRLVAELIRALQTPSEPSRASKLEAVGGAVPLASEFYVSRRADEEFCQAIARRDSIVLVKGARQIGKTSLLARGLQQARDAGAKIVFTDFQSISDESLQTPDSFYFALCRFLKRELKLSVSIKDTWDDDFDAPGNMEYFLRQEVLGRIDGSLVWGLDEVDRLFTCPFGGQVFGLFRSWHNRRATDPTGPWSRLTLAMAYATEASLFITDLNQSPFNVGTRLTLDDFTPEQVSDLNRRYGNPLRTSEERQRFYALVGGQPYLTRRGLDEMAARKSNLTALEAQAECEEGLFGDHLRRILVLLARDSQLLSAVRAFLREGTPISEDSFYRLRSAGVMEGVSSQEARFRCQLYSAYLKRHLL